MPPKLLALLPANQIPRTLACVARRDSGKSGSTPYRIEDTYDNSTDLHHLAASMSIIPYLPSHKEYVLLPALCHRKLVGATTPPTRQILALRVSSAWVAYWRCAEAGSPVQSPLLPQASMRPADMQCKCRSCWLTCVLICCYRQRKIGFVVTYIVLWKLISKLLISILEPDLKACKKASEAVFMEKSEERLEGLNFLRVWMQRRRKADFPGPPPRACAAETFPMMMGYPNSRQVWEKTGVAIELGNSLIGGIASE